MNDVTGMPQTAVVIGGSSDLAVALLKRLCGRRLRSVVLAGPNEERLGAAAAELKTAGADEVHCVVYDVREASAHDALVEDATRRLASVDLVVVAAGVLGTSDLEQMSASGVQDELTTNFTGPAAAITGFAKLLLAQGFGRIVVYSSVAGVRVRKANFVYGAAKAGLDGFCQGLSDTLYGSGVSVMIVRPGFVKSKMTAHLKVAPLSVGVDEVADAVVRGLEQGRSVIWSPRLFSPITAVFRVLPRAVWRRLPM